MSSAHLLPMDPLYGLRFVILLAASVLVLLALCLAATTCRRALATIVVVVRARRSAGRHADDLTAALERLDFESAEATVARAFSRARPRRSFKASRRAESPPSRRSDP